jgi:Zn-dependent protease/predicted transcriptional regulator
VKWSFPVGRPFGVEVRLHVTFLLLLAFWGYVGWKQTGSIQAALMGLGFHVILFGCVLLHEFGHVLMARRFGIQTRDVTLLPIGGVARLESTGNNPREELLIALAGPAVNVVLAALAAVWIWLHPPNLDEFDPSTLRGNLPALLLVSNTFLVLFNLLPAFPMDGGRVLRAILSWNGDRVRATRIAAGLGRLMAVLFALAGLFWLQNPMLMFIALFVWMGANQESAAAQAHSLLHGVPVRAAMLTEFRTLEPFDTLDDASRAILAGSQTDFPVVAQGDVVGLLLREDLFAALRNGSGGTLVREVMRQNVPVTRPDAPLESVLQQVQASPDGLTTVPVLEEGRLVGVLTAENVGEFVMLASVRSGRKV